MERLKAVPDSAVLAPLSRQAQEAVDVIFFATGPSTSSCDIVHKLATSSAVVFFLP